VSHLLDSNACIDHLRRGTASKVTAKLFAAPLGSVFLCSVVVGELLFGALRSRQPASTLTQVRAFCAPYVSLAFDDRAADEYSVIRSHLTTLGQLIGPNDLMIAAIALANRLTLVTHNTSEFSRVQGLALEDWQRPRPGDRYLSPGVERGCACPPWTVAKLCQHPLPPTHLREKWRTRTCRQRA
jgi:tRNA(fMet)-specific endonuclease VapC